MLLLFGGIHDVTHEKNDIMIFHIEKSRWMVVEKETKWMFTEDQQHSPRSNASKMSKKKAGRRNSKLNNLESPSKELKPSRFGPVKGIA